MWTCCPLKDNQEYPCASVMPKDVHISLLMVAVCFIHTFLTCRHYSFSLFRSCRGRLGVVTDTFMSRSDWSHTTQEVDFTSRNGSPHYVELIEGFDTL
jgi:hypothetical protein